MICPILRCSLQASKPNVCIDAALEKLLEELEDDELLEKLDELDNECVLGWRIMTLPEQMPL